MVECLDVGTEAGYEDERGGGELHIDINMWMRQKTCDSGRT